MSAQASLVYRNFIWRIEDISPSYTAGLKRFTFNERIGGLVGEQSSGMTRDFAIYFDGASAVMEPNDLSGRMREFVFSVEVIYSTDFKLNTISDIILQDDYDLVACLRDDTKWVGYSDVNSSTDIKLWKRMALDSKVDRANQIIWKLTQRYECTVWEDD